MAANMTIAKPVGNTIMAASFRVAERPEDAARQVAVRTHGPNPATEFPGGTATPRAAATLHA
jgi:hypothetical protein